MDETETDDVVTVGQRLREAREAKGLSIEDIAAQTRIPTRHLASLETGEWDKLPAATYSVGFAKNYAGAVGLDRSEISEQLRAEMGGTRPAFAPPDIFEAADPARTMPKGLVFGALGLLALLVLALTWFNNRSLEPDVAVAAENMVAPLDTPLVQPVVPSGSQPVVLTATDAVWIEVKDGANTLKQGQLAPGERYEIPASAVAPTLTTGKPEALTVAVGSQQAPPVGEAGRTVSGVSLKAADLLRQGPAANPGNTARQVPPAATPTAAPTASRQPRPSPATVPASTGGEDASEPAPPIASETTAQP